MKSNPRLRKYLPVLSVFFLLGSVMLLKHCGPSSSQDPLGTQGEEWRKRKRGEDSSRRGSTGLDDSAKIDPGSSDRDKGRGLEDPVIIDASKPTPVGGTPGGEDKGSGQGQDPGGQAGGQGEGKTPAPGPGEAETPPQFEDVWTFYHYCLIAEDQIEAEKVKDFFPDEEYFAQWLDDIRKTVAAIRVRLNRPRDMSVASTETCQIAYDTFRSKRTFSLAPRPGEVFEINNIEPISGLPNLRDLDLYDNKIIKIGFLRNLTALEYLEVGKNKIERVTPLMRDMENHKGLTKLIELRIELQNDEESPLQLDGVHYLHPYQNLRLVKINANLVDPNPFRGFHDQLEVSLGNRLWFIAGSPSCLPTIEQNGIQWVYPKNIERERKKRC